MIRETRIDGRRSRTLIDTGCSVTLIGEHVVHGRRRTACNSMKLEMMNRAVLHTLGTVELGSILTENGVELGPAVAHVVHSLPLNVDVVLGLDVLSKNKLELSCQNGEIEVQFNNSGRSTSIASYSSEAKPCELEIEDKDFTAKFQGGCWVASWCWKDEDNLDSLHKKPCDYVHQTNRLEFDREIESWVHEGILTPYRKDDHGEIRGYLPLMAVKQFKGEECKIRPVLDYRKMNEAVQSFPGGAVPICSERLREWRMRGDKGSLLDLKRAYLQIHIEKSLWVYQAVKWNGHLYLLTRLGFGLSVAPKIMTAIVEKVLAQNQHVNEAVSSYVDDLFIDASKIDPYYVKKYLLSYGLETKEPDNLGDKTGTRILGMKVNGDLKWERDNTLPILPDDCTRRQIHSIVGELVGHFPVASWLRPYCSFLQRLTAISKLGWDEIAPRKLSDLLGEIFTKMKHEGDPASGRWPVSPHSPMTIWADASGLAIGVALEVDGVIIEDAAWLRPRNDSAHINLSELDAVIKGLNTALRWGKREFTIKTDSSTVYKWLRAVINRTHNVKSRALSERLIRRRLDTLREIIEVEKIQIEPVLVPTEENLADRLTRVPKYWQHIEKDWLENISAQFAGAGVELDSHTLFHDIKAIHDRCHFGVERTLNLAKEKLGTQVSKKIVKKVVSRCDRCAKIDPSIQFRWEQGTLSCSNIWERIAIDITYVKGTPYLSIVDLASRFTIWRELRSESASEIIAHLSQVFGEFGPPSSIMSDNATAFRGREFNNLIDNWGISHTLTCAYRSQGNGVIERMHRTVKRCAMRSSRSIQEAVFWVNNSRDGNSLSPYEIMFAASSRKPGINKDRQEITRPQVPISDFKIDHYSVDRNPLTVGDRVYLRNPDGRCDNIWSGPHTVTDIRSSVGVVLNDDGITRHVSHVRIVPGEMSENEEVGNGFLNDEDDDDYRSRDSLEDIINVRRSSRTPRRPLWMNDYIC